MAFTVPASNVSTSATAVATAIALTGGPRAVFVVDVSWFRAAGADANPISVTDSIGNTYVAVGATISFGTVANFRARRYVCIGGTGGAAVVVTVNFTNANDAVTIFVRGALSSAGTSIVQDQAPAGLADAHSDATPYVSNNATTLFAAELLLACAFTASNTGTETFTQGNSFVTDTDQGNTAVITGTSSHRIVAATGTFATSMTSGGGAGTTEAVTFLTTFREAAVDANALFFGAFP
jgi:hypothetical protein